jgi:hypothetical protein
VVRWGVEPLCEEYIVIANGPAQSGRRVRVARHATDQAIVCLVLMLVASHVAAQDTSTVAKPHTDTVHTGQGTPAAAPMASATQDTALVVTPCNGRIVSAVTIRPQVPYYAGYGGQWRPLARMAASVHATTHANVIRSFLALHPGDVCTEERRKESERILLAQPFLSEAKVTAYDDHLGGVRIDVFTADEVSVLGALAARSQAPHFLGVRAGDANLAGEGIRVIGEWGEGLQLRDHWGGRITDYAFANRPIQLSVEGNRDQLGGDWSATLVHPFLTDLQRFAWIAEAGELRTYVSFLTPSSNESPTLDFSRHYGQVGGIARFGSPGHVTLFGLSVSDDNETSGTQPLLVGGDSVVLVSNPGLVSRYSGYRAARINILYGIRDVSFLRVRGFDALNGEQDLLQGVQIGTLAGRSVEVLGATEQDALFASTISAGAGSPTMYAGIQAEAQARRDLRAEDWNDVIVGGRAAWYWKPAAAHTITVSEEYGLGILQTVPFELTLSDLRGGVRGYHDSQSGGGERTVTRFEERWLLGPVKDFGEIGVAAFTDVGRIWAEGVPYGVNTPTAVGVGVSLLAAIPIHSKRLWRVDFAVPATHDPNAGRYEVRFSANDASGRFYIEPHDLARARERTVPTSIFEYPPQ